MIETREWEQLWLPVRPLASDDLRAGIYRQSRPSALRRRYIEANPHALSNLLVVDIDHEDALMRALWDRSPRKEHPRVASQRGDREPHQRPRPCRVGTG